MNVDVDYRYPRPSTLIDRALALETSTPGVLESQSYFVGFVERAEVAGAALRAVAAVARSRFYVPANVIAAVLRAADPIVTSDGEGLRFESLSVCCGVYARLDLLGGGLEGEVATTGTTNVDVSPKLRDALGRLGPGDPLRLSVGPDELRVQTLDDDVVERRVPLPERWLRSLAEVAVSTSSMEPRFVLSGAEARRFVLGDAGRRSRGGVWVVPAAGRSARLSARSAPQSVYLGGGERLGPLGYVLPHTTELMVFGAPGPGDQPAASAWVANLPGARLTVALSPEPRRGFSGEGGVLDALVSDGAFDDAERVAGALARRQRSTPASLVVETGVEQRRVSAGLVVLGTAGRVGFDVTAGEYFSRELPFSPEATGAIHPRARAARALARAGDVHVEGDRATVRSGETTYTLVLADGGWRCNCPWGAAHAGTRGPCKHSLAVLLAPGR